MTVMVTSSSGAIKIKKNDPENRGIKFQCATLAPFPQSNVTTFLLLQLFFFFTAQKQAVN